MRSEINKCWLLLEQELRLRMEQQRLSGATEDSEYVQKWPASPAADRRIFEAKAPLAVDAAAGASG
jgi:hypothetical protein